MNPAATQAVGPQPSPPTGPGARPDSGSSADARSNGPLAHNPEAQPPDAQPSAAQAETVALSPAATDRGRRGRPGGRRKRSIMDRIDAFISKLSTRNNFWHRVCSLIWLPYAARSGIAMRQVDQRTFTAVLPFKRFNRNWYNAMAGAALLGNSEIAGGMFVFKACGADYTVVCKKLEYQFLRPCLGPAVYRIEPRENIEQTKAEGGEFNVTLDMTVLQMARKPGDSEKRVGKVVVTFHVTPKTHQQAKGRQIRG